MPEATAIEFDAAPLARRSTAQICAHTGRRRAWAAAFCLAIGMTGVAHARTPATPPTDEELLHQAVHACRSVGAKHRDDVDTALLAQLLELERQNGVPEAYRGMTLAKACIESGYRAASRGDCKDGSCRAVGMIQLWPWTEKYGVDRTDPVASVRFLLERVQAGMEGGRLRKLCGTSVRTELDAYRLAWLRINRGPLQGGVQRCAGTPKGLKRLRQWQHNIAHNRREAARQELLAARAAKLARLAEARAANRAEQLAVRAARQQAMAKARADRPAQRLAAQAARRSQHSLRRPGGAASARLPQR